MRILFGILTIFASVVVVVHGVEVYLDLCNKNGTSALVNVACIIAWGVVAYTGIMGYKSCKAHEL